MKIVVIGSGFGGLAAAIRLQAKGHTVTLVEKRDKLGGRAYVYEQDGFTFDGGPTVVTAPWLFEEVFQAAGEKLSDHVQLVPVDPFYQIRFEDGSVFHYNADRDNLIRQIERFNPDDVVGYERFIGTTEDIFNTGFGLIDQSFDKFGAMLKVLPDLIRLGSHRSVYTYVSKFIKDERLRQVFSFHSLLVGGNPFQTTNIYTLIHFLEKKWGVWYAMGGTGSIVKAFGELLTALGGTTRLNTEVDEILIEPTRSKPTARGVRLKGGEEIQADSVVCNGDVAFAYKHLVPARFRRTYTDRKLDRLDYSMSLFVLYFGTDRRYDDVAHHTILLGPRYEGLLDDIFRKHKLADDFSLYLHRPTRTDPTMAPAGCDAWYVLAPVPHLASGTDWRVQAKPYRDAIVAYLEEKLLPGLSGHIVTEHWIDPLHFRDTLNSHLGSAFSVEPTLMQSAWMRPHNISEDIANLYFVGAGTHPGAGMPGVLSSAKIVEKLIDGASEREAVAESLVG